MWYSNDRLFVAESQISLQIDSVSTTAKSSQCSVCVEIKGAAAPAQMLAFNKQI